jgi:hypothetical protein
MYIPVELLALGIIRYWSFVRVIAQLSELLLEYGTIRDDSRPVPRSPERGVLFVEKRGGAFLTFGMKKLQKM